MFKKQRPTSVGDIAGFENIRHEDQEKIRKKIGKKVIPYYVVIYNHNLIFVVRIEECGTTVVIAQKKGGKRAAASEPKVQMSAAAARDYGIEYAKSGRAGCCGCQDKILKVKILLLR